MIFIRPGRGGMASGWDTHKGNKMQKYRLLILVLLLISGSMLHAQEVGVEESDLPQREIYTVLAFGEDVFEPERWYTSAAESAGRTTATWTAKAESGFVGALAYADYLHFDGGYTSEGLTELFNDAWFDGVLANYESHTSTTACQSEDGLMLFEFTVNSDGTPYTMRYWVEPVEETRVMALFIVFPAGDVAARRLLETYAQALYPALSICPR